MFGWAYHEIILDDAGEPVDYVFLKANKIFEQFTGLKRADIIGRGVTEIIPGIENAEPNLIKKYGEVALTGESQQFELYFAPFDRWYSVFANCPKHGFFNAIFEEISSRKQAEMELERSNQDLEQFAYVASHDLQEPLRMVSSYTELLGKRYSGKLDEQADKFINYAVDGARRMQDLINDLLAFSRVGPRARTANPVDLNAVFEEVIDGLHLTIQELGGEVSAHDLPTVMADPLQARQLLQNLIANALKFHGEDPPVVRVTARRREEMWEMSVADNGIGIRPEYEERIFGIFQRLHQREDYPGTGIGLAVVKRIVECNGGEIRLESEVGEGATFHFTLPAAEGA